MITKLTAENNELYLARLTLMNQAFGSVLPDGRIRADVDPEDTSVPAIPSNIQAFWTSLESERLVTTPLYIASLEEYFANIHTIYQFTQAFPQYTARCLAMAADEPMFEIDANSRVINVPAVFKKNGIAVMGDHKAEIVYFKIDKYFDFTNFYDLLQDSQSHIAINWMLTTAGAKNTLDQDKVQSVYAFGPSDDLVPGSLVFGWIIDKSMTDKPGTLTFSVQIYHETNEPDILDYSFNTLTATVAVGNTLVMNKPSVVTDNSLDLGNRLKNSAYRVEGIDGPVEPEWLTIWENGAEANIPFGEDSIDVPAQAGIEKGITIQYRWFKQEFGSDSTVEVTPVSGEEPNPADKYILTTDEWPVATKLYYTVVFDNNDNIVGRTLLTGAVPNKPTTEAGWEIDEENDSAKCKAFKALHADPQNAEPVYERCSVLTVDTAGLYRVEASAKVDLSDYTWAQLDETARAQVEAMTKTRSSEILTVPAAESPVVELTVTSGLGEDDYKPLSDYEEYSELAVEGPFTYVSNDASKSPSITAVITSDRVGALASVMLDEEDKVLGTEDVAFAAYEAPMSAFVDYSAAEEREVLLNSSDTGLVAEGQYKVGIINYLNGTYAKGTSAAIETSFVAPKVHDIDLMVNLGTGNASEAVLQDGLSTINVTINNETRRGVRSFDINDVALFVLTHSTYEDLAAGYTGDLKVKYYLEEVTTQDTGSNVSQQSVFELKVDSTSDENNITYLGEPVFSENEELTPINFVPADEGYYRIRIDTIYNNTVNTDYTDVFALYHM
jgi:hypothetical protein